MAILYGVLRGRPDRYKREDNASTPHLQIRVLEKSGQPWRIAVNVKSDSGSNVAFWVVDPLVEQFKLEWFVFEPNPGGKSGRGPRLRQGAAVRLEARAEPPAVRQRQQ